MKLLFNDFIYLQVVQCMIYERGDQHVSKTARSILGMIFMASFVMLILSLTNVVIWLDYLNFLSFMKLFITLIKYIPQVSLLSSVAKFLDIIYRTKHKN